MKYVRGAEFFDTPQPGGGLFAVGEEDTTNIFFFEDTNDFAIGGNEVDIIMSMGGDDNVSGTGGADFLFGGLGNDLVRGGTGDDLVVGSEGADLLVGGDGSDIFEFFANQFTPGELDIILDFEPEADALVIVGSTDISYDPISGLLSVDGREVVSLAADLDLDIVSGEISSAVFSND